MPTIKGTKLSESHRRNLSLAMTGVNKGKKWPKWFGLRISAGLLGKKLSREHKDKLSLVHTGVRRPELSGEKHWNWKGGKTKELLAIRNSLDYKLWRRAVYERDGYMCVLCGDKKGGNLQADHIKPFSKYPKLRFNVDNGRTLCKKCHQKTDTWGGRINERKR